MDRNHKKEEKQISTTGKMKLVTITLLVIILTLANITLASDEDELNELYCQLNTYSKERAANNLDIFPCLNSKSKN